MFIQVITGRTSDPQGLRRRLDQWQKDLRPGAAGYLGSTGGVTDDGRVVAMIRFESEAAARANSAREEQGNWWAETEKYFDDVAFRDSVKVTTMRGGGSDAAGFVQVMRGHVTDPAKMANIEARTAEFEAGMAGARPDILGDVIVMHADGTYTDAVYFTSEAAARQAETQEMPAELQGLFEELMSAIAIDEYLDLKDPWMN